jgi:hypothetical protein
MEYLEDIKHNDNKNTMLKTEDVAGILDVHVDAVKTLVDIDLLPCMRIGPRFEPRFRIDDVRFLLLK